MKGSGGWVGAFFFGGGGGGGGWGEGGKVVVDVFQLTPQKNLIRCSKLHFH